MNISLHHEEILYINGHNPVAGVDEAGRGPLAGPVVACAVIMPRHVIIDGVQDSKKISPKRRTELALLIKKKALAYGLGMVDVETIGRINILQATLLAMAQAINALGVTPGAVIIDGPHGPELPTAIYRCCLPHGDSISHSVAAASILAKVTRDAYMQELHLKYPEYGFYQHKGYGTAAHIAALRRYGPCPQHRAQFIRRVMYNENQS